MDRKKEIQRRDFLKKASLATLAGLVGTQIAFADKFPRGLIPQVLLDEEEPFTIAGKSKDLVILNDRPINAETPAHLLDDAITPSKYMFVRNNGVPPKNVDFNDWTLTIEGESAGQTKTYSIQQLKKQFQHHTFQLTLECGGNGRSEFSPPAKGNQWTTGAVSCAEWTGVRLKDILNDIGVKSDAVYIGYYGKDTHLSGDTSKVVISRGVPIEKAMEDETLIAWAMNGEEIPYMNGAPLRLVIGGWPASTSGKWLSKISVRNKVHDGAKMGGMSYRIPKYDVAPGTDVPPEDFEIIESMPVKSLVTYPKSGAIVKPGQKFEVRGHAWAGDLSVKEMHISIDYGSSWIKCELRPPVNRLAWQHWKTIVTLPEKGYYEIWARATDAKGNMQPMVLPGWNPKGYLNNACHRIAVKRS